MRGKARNLGRDLSGNVRAPSTRATDDLGLPISSRDVRSAVKGEYRLTSQRNGKRFGVALVGLIGFALSLLISVQVHAQVTGGTLLGTVTDSSGATIPNVQLSIKNIATGVIRTVTTDSAGFYTAPNLLPGSYDVSFSASGFATEVEESLSLAVGDQRTLNVTMKVGQVAQKVEVTAEAPTVQLASSTLSAEVNGTTVRELPLNGRDWTSLANLQPGVVPVRTEWSASAAGAGSRGARGYGNQISDAGHRPQENNFRINGINVDDGTNSGPGSVLGGALGVDGIQEFSVLTSNYSAEYGRTTGAVINAITKSGTNGFHGDAYWFLRDQALDARNFFDPLVIPPFHRNNFGASLGGPIKKEKTFFFFDFEAIHQDKNIAYHDFVPSAAARAGNLCSNPGGVTPSCTPTTITVSPLVTPFFPLYPLPDAGSIGNGDIGVFNTTALQGFNENYETAKIDHRISERDSLAVSWLLDRGSFAQPDALGNVISSNVLNRQLFTLEETHVLSPTFVNTVRAGYNRVTASSTIPVSALNPVATDPSLGALPGKDAPALTVPSLTLMAGGLNANGATYQTYNSFQAYDDAFLTRGSHSLKFGFAWEHIQFYTQTLSKPGGSFKFPSLEGFLLDEPTSIQYGNPDAAAEVYSRQSVFAGYVQDDWRARPNLTLNFGLRYEPTTLPTEAHDRFQSIVSVVDGPFGQEPCCSGSVPVHTLWAKNATLTNFDPRLGFSWAPFPDHKTAIRGSFGIFDNLPLNWLYGGVGEELSYPFALLETISGLAPGSFPSGAASPTFNLAKARQRYVQQDPPRSYVMNWNLNIQHELSPGLVMTVGYVGSHSIHNPLTPDDMDMVLPTLTSAGYLWPFPVGSGTEYNSNVGSIRGLPWTGRGVFSGLEAEITKQMAHGFQAQGSYTWSKCIDDGSTGAVGDQFSNSVSSLLWIDEGSRHGLCDYNVSQNLVVNYVWDLPKPKFGGSVVSYVLGGWETTGVFTASTGQPFTLIIAGDPQGQKGTPEPYPDRIAGCNPVNGNYRSSLSYVNLSCFTPPVVPASFPNYATSCQPAAASVAAVIPFTCMNLQGNAGRNRLSGPGLINLDFSLIKNTYLRRISESADLQFRAEVFNLFNRADFQAPLDNLSVLNQNGTTVSGAGAIDSTSADSREIQLALKFIW